MPRPPDATSRSAPTPARGSRGRRRQSAVGSRQSAVGTERAQSDLHPTRWDCRLPTADCRLIPPAPRQHLLVLDNCEHLAEACASLAEALLGAAPRLRIVATSRQPLGLTGETTWPVPPLSLPETPEGRKQKAEGSPTRPKPDCLLP